MTFPNGSVIEGTFIGDDNFEGKSHLIFEDSSSF